MSRGLIALFIFLLVFLLFFIFVIWNLARQFPALFLNLNRKRRNWLKESIGKPFLTEEEVNEIRSKLHTLEVTKHNGVLHKIGTAAYIDHGPEYRYKAKNTNIMLQKTFPWLYDKLIVHLETRLPKVNDDQNATVKCQYAIEHDISIPGFHIFPGKSLLGKGWAIASLHIDMQEKQVPWPTYDHNTGTKFEFDWDRTFSFTIPISVTKDSGLYVFKKKAKHLNYSLPLSLTLRNVPRQKVIYEPGQCYVHHGKSFHLISPFKGRQKDGTYVDRITIQGHCLYCKTTKSYWVYW